jgi:hypothetical protein
MIRALLIIAAILGCLALAAAVSCTHWKAAVRHTALCWYLMLRAEWRSLRADLTALNAVAAEALWQRDPRPLQDFRDSSRAALPRRPGHARPAHAAPEAGPAPCSPGPAGTPPVTPVAGGVPLADVAAMRAMWALAPVPSWARDGANPYPAETLTDMPAVEDGPRIHPAYRAHEAKHAAKGWFG